MSDLLFVYGTLRKGNSNQMAEYLSTHAAFLTGGWFRGRMYQISFYPGVIASDHMEDRIYGEVYSLHDAQASFAVFDAYEECSAEHAQPAEYQRVKAHIDTIDGNASVQAWIYLYQWSVTDKVLIKEGDFMKRLLEA